MNRLATRVGVVKVEGVDLVVIEVVGRKNAVCVFIDLEEDDRRHQGAREVPGVVLSEQFMPMSA